MTLFDAVRSVFRWRRQTGDDNLATSSSDNASNADPSPPSPPSWWERLGSAALTGRIRGAFAFLRGPEEGPQEALRLRYFETVLRVEFGALNARRTRLRIPAIEPLPVPDSQSLLRQSSANPEQTASVLQAGRVESDDPLRSPDLGMLFGAHAMSAVNSAPVDEPAVDPHAVIRSKTRPLPVPCSANGLALSGGGIRAAAVSLGVLQALKRNGRIKPLDYLSTVSGGGYMGCSMSAAMSVTDGEFPFGDDVSDNEAMAHLRNYSNYLMPRGRSGLTNGSDVAAILLRGFAGNAVIVLFAMLLAAILTIRGYANGHHDATGIVGFIPALIDSFLPLGLKSTAILGNGEFGLTLRLCWILLALLIVWAVARRAGPNGRWTGDTAGRLLSASRVLIALILVSGLLDLQPLAADGFACLVDWIKAKHSGTSVGAVLTALSAFATSVAAFGSRIGKFLDTSARASGMKVLLARLVTKAVLVLAAMIVPLLLWCSYLALVAAALVPWKLPPWLDLHPLRWLANHITLIYPPSGHFIGVAQSLYGRIPSIVPTTHGPLYGWVCLTTFAILTRLNANSYSLHRFYRDRLSKAFLFRPNSRWQDTDEPIPLDAIKLSALRGSNGPYHILNAALNVQGSEEANRRGRNADFFTFTADHVGSDLTLYAETASATPGGGAVFEGIDRDLDLATAMAISGAAVSANMGSSTVRLLSPTLALLNVRLGYWMANPRFLARQGTLRKSLKATFDVLTNFFLPAEMLNLLDESGRKIYLTDGGHIENLGVYELLKRGCGLIIVVDAEADPTLSFESLLRLERYARIDLGVRIILPWERIAAANAAASEAIAAREPCEAHGPHCAVGKILYNNNAEGMVVYIKSSLSGDEKDYIRDYKIRNPTFPHETTGDQFFSEEQFEMYRALGFHIADGFFGTDDVAFIYGADGYRSRQHLIEEFSRRCPRMP